MFIRQINFYFLFLSINFYVNRIASNFTPHKTTKYYLKFCLSWSATHNQSDILAVKDKRRKKVTSGIRGIGDRSIMESVFEDSVRAANDIDRSSFHLIEILTWGTRLEEAQLPEIEQAPKKGTVMLNVVAPGKLVLTLQSIPPFVVETIFALTLTVLLAVPLILRVQHSLVRALWLGLPEFIPVPAYVRCFLGISYCFHFPLNVLCASAFDKVI